MRVELSASAVRDLDALIATHSLPTDTRERVRRSLRGLTRFPYLGVELIGSWSGFRCLLGPWKWMLIVYTVLEPENLVLVVTIEDGRKADSASAEG